MVRALLSIATLSLCIMICGCGESQSPKPDSPKSDNPKPDSPKPDSPKPDSPKPDSPKPDSPKPDSPKPDSPKPVIPKQKSPIPDDADQLVLFSLDGTVEVADRSELEKPASKDKYLYGFPILGKVEVKDANQKREILTAIEKALQKPPPPANCFWPRHAIRTVKGGKIQDFVVCFECNTYSVFHGVEPTGGMLTPAISNNPEPLLDKILSDAGVPLAKKSLK
ncbi:MAG: hypothetical protein KF873_14305 [Gemmataceae bacterium]|nr:hypothetical protein [Gemmataceae bacterium]